MPTIVFSIVLLLVVLILSYLAWKRSDFSRGVGLLELLRILIVFLVCLTLMQPEWREVFIPNEKPVLAVLRDTSASMDTADVSDQNDLSAPALKRSEIAQSIIETDRWQSLDDKMKVIFQSFSSTEQPASSASDINSALNELLETIPNLRGVVLISDGDWNTGESPARASTRLRMRDTPVFALPVGSENRVPDIEISSFDVPTFATAEKNVRLPFSISSSLPNDYSATVEIESSNGEKLNKVVSVPAMGKVQDFLEWKPKLVGDYTLEIRIPKAPQEKNIENNSIEVPISIRKESLEVLIIESFPRWEYRYLKNALERDPGVKLTSLLFHPDLPNKTGDGVGYIDSFPSVELLAKMDVIFLGDVGMKTGQLTGEQCQALRSHVANQAGGLVFLPGFRGHQHSLLETELSDLLPVVLDEAQPRGWGAATPGQFELTDLGLRSLLTRLEDSEDDNANTWASLPGFQWFAGVLRAKSGSEVLATHSSEANRYGRIPLIVTKTFGTGKILYMGTDGAWRWRKGVEDKYHYRFWGQVARWMAYQRNISLGETMRLFYSPDRPQAGDALTLNANVLSVGGEPLQNANVVVQVKSPSGKIQSVKLQPGSEDQWGLFSATITPKEPGEYSMVMTCAENGGTLNSVITVQGALREKIGQPARIDVMQEIAKISRGALFEKPDLEAIIARINQLPDPTPEIRPLRIWAHPLWIGLIILLLIIFWIGRKVVGAI